MTDYTLVISDVEVGRYRTMAANALVHEAAQMREAGIVEGAVVADIGCGPAAMTVALAGEVGATGRVIGIERDEQSLAVARALLAQSASTNVELRAGDATATGIAPGSVDVVMMRHVLAHNGRHEQAIVDHLATLPRAGGSVYLVDSDLTAIRILDADPDLDDLSDTYVRFHANRGNDPSVGLRLGTFLQAAGLDLISFTGTYNIVRFVPGMRPPAWAARDTMLAEHAVTEDDLQRWDAAFQRTDAASARPVIFAPTFVAIGRNGSA